VPADQKFIHLTNAESASEYPPFIGASGCVFVPVDCIEDAISKLSTDTYSAVIMDREFVHDNVSGNVFQDHRLLNLLPDAIALLDCENKIQWGNQRLTEWFPKTDLVGLNFYDAIDRPDIIGRDTSPCTIALNTRKTCRTLLRNKKKNYFEMHAVPIIAADGAANQLVITLRDVTEEKLEREKLELLHRAGMELADLTPDEICQMDVEERIELLKANILHYTQDLLQFDVAEIRLHEQESNRLIPLISVGIDSDESQRDIFAEARGNGVTGFVVATGKSYLCEDTTNDPLYLDGLIGAKSSLTVPLIYHDQVIGSFNVESPKTGAFDESDLQFLEIFARDIAVALNTLELLVAQRANTAKQSVEAIYSAVALPIDEILNDTVHVIEDFVGHNPEVAKRLRSILTNARHIKQTIQKVGARIVPENEVPRSFKVPIRPLLYGRRVLVIDSDEEVRNSAHTLLERYGCEVETAHEGGEAILMIRNCSPEQLYSAIIADIRLPDVDGYEFLLQLKGIMEHPPLVLMTGFGYDPGHSIVKARKAGLPPNAILYKPFRLDQLLETLESVVTETKSSA
jgi:CheY-like chemotaxis protein